MANGLALGPAPDAYIEASRLRLTFEGGLVRLVGRVDSAAQRRSDRLPAGRPIGYAAPRV
ncbi:MAG: hypothetical protein RMA76_06835 [Deltaproteobacteria bacterium]